MKLNQLTRLIVAGALGCLSTSVLAASVTPAVVAGNPTCASVGLTGVGDLKIDPPNAGTYPFSFPITGGSIAGTITVSTDGVYFDWSKSPTPYNPVLVVLAKGGPNANMYDYRPAGAFSDTGLHSPINPSNGNPYGLSHINFCIDLTPPPEPQLTASKQMDGDWERRWTWTLDKSVTPGVIDMFEGDTHDVEYTVSGSATAAVTYRLYGTVEIEDEANPTQITSINSFDDEISFYDAGDNFLGIYVPSGAELSNCDSLLPVRDGNVVYRCEFDIELEASDVGFDLAAVRRATNDAEVSLTSSVQGPVNLSGITDTFIFGANPDAEYGDELAVVDPTVPALDDTFTAPSGSNSATVTLDCDDKPKVTNTATGTYSTPGGPADVQDSAEVDIYCRTVSISKTADAEFDRTYRWEADKYVLISASKYAELDPSYQATCTLIVGGPNDGMYKCEKSLVVLGNGQTLGIDYLVEIQKLTDFDDNYRISGNILITWPKAQHGGGDPDLTIPPADVITFLGGATSSPIPVCGAVDASDPNIKSISCTYAYQSNVAPPALSGNNVATVTRTKKCYDAEGAASDCGTQDTASAPANFAFALDGTTNNCVEVVDYFNDDLIGDVIDGNLCASTSVVVSSYSVSALDVADYAVLDEENCLWTVPNLIKLFSNDSSDEWSSNQADLDVSVPSLCQVGCTLTPGYWKTHSAYGPAPYDPTWALIGEDTAFFLSGQSWYQVLWTAPKGGNAYYILAHAYIAATLNTLNLNNPAVLSGDQLTAYNFATSVFNSYTPAQIGALKGNNSLRSQIIAAAGVLDAWNNGITGPGHCDE